MADMVNKLMSYVDELLSQEVKDFIRRHLRISLMVGTGVGLLWWIIKKPKGIPPGPKLTLPIVGDMLSLVNSNDKGDIRLPFRRMRAKYGDIYSLYIGKDLFVVLNGFEFIKEALVKNGDVFSHRPTLFFIDMITKGKGIVNSNGEYWKIQRKFTMEVLRKFGMGKSILEDKIQEEIEALTVRIKKEDGKNMEMSKLMQGSISNVISNLVFGRRLEYDDPLLQRFLHAAEENIEAIQLTGLVNSYPFLRFLPGDPFLVKRTMKNVKFAEDEIIKPAIEDHLKNYNEDDIKDYISAYIKEIKRLEKLNQNTFFDMESLVACTGDLYVAGTETTSTTLLWSFLFFLHYPHMKERCYQEICDVVGTSRYPSMKDKSNMPYLDAFTIEIMRMCNITPLGVPHALATEVQFHGYRFPKEAIIIPNLDSVLASEQIWGDPQTFRPERFLNKEGKVTKREEFIPFSIGRRSCLGESLARMELYLFLSSLLQRFDFLPVDPKSLPPIKGSFGATHTPLKYEVRLVPRKL